MLEGDIARPKLFIRSRPETELTDTTADAPPVAATGSKPSLFASDRAAGPDRHGIGVAIEPLARLVAHPQAEAPFTVGIFGGSGSGKSFALETLLRRVEELGKSGEGAAAGLVTVRVDAARAGDEPVTLLAGDIYEALNDASYSDIAQDCAQSGRDPAAVAREAADRLGETRRKLDAERLSLNELEGRRLRLTETVLYDTTGSRIESYARANRARLDSRLRAFGFATNDPVATYKDLVRDISEGGGLTGRVGAFLHSLWAFKGQTKLLVWAVVFFLISFGLERLFGSREVWLGWLRETGGEKLGPTMGFVQDNVGVVALAARLAFWAAVAALAVNVLRALRFTMPLFRGVRLLRGDLETRKRELDGLIAHQTRLVGALDKEADALARRVDEAEKRAGSAAPAAPAVERPFDAPGTGKLAQAARNFLAALGREIPKRAGRSPRRIVVAIDNVDSASPEAASRLIETAHSLLGSSFVTALAVDPSRLWGADAARQAKFVNVPWRVPAAIASNDVQKVSLDESLTSVEAQTVERLNALFAAGPRAAKMLMNLYRLGRTQTSERAALALLMAIDVHGSDEERAQLARVLADGRTSFSGRVEQAYAVVGPVPTDDLRAAASVARIYATHA